MKIYFAGSIRGGRDDADLYLEIIKYLKNFGEVLTEHVGDNLITSSGESSINDTAIHDRDMDWLISSDIIVAEVTNPSLGVGYEIGRALENNKKIICVYRRKENKKISAMILGSKNILSFEYQDLESLKKILSSHI